MPDDGLFDDKPKGDDAPAPTPQVAAPAQPAQVDLSPVMTELKQLGNRIGAVEQHFQQLTAPAPPVTDTDDDMATKLLTDPKSVLAEAFKANAKETLGPMLGMMAEDRKMDVLERYEQEIDKVFGEGTWAEEFQPEVDAATGKLPPEMMSRGHLRVMVNSIKGDKFEKLVERGAKLEEAAEEAAKQTEPPTMLGTGYRSPEEPAFSQDLKEFCAEISKATGEKHTPEEWNKLAAKGDTEDDWKPEEAQ
jgi:hypothetical protein